MLGMKTKSTVEESFRAFVAREVLNWREEEELECVSFGLFFLKVWNGDMGRCNGWNMKHTLGMHCH